jgi:REP element-mobilizing transposase RayT
VPGGYYHVVLRGNHRKDLFGTRQDRDVLNDILADSLSCCLARLHAFCWMTNHLHALVQVHDQPLGKLMQRIAMRYSRYRHRQLRTTGHSFERRYKAWLIDADSYFLTCLRYIHLNPVKAGIVSEPNEYSWSSHRAYLGTETLAWVTTEFGLGLFGQSVDHARQAYQRFMAQPIYASEDRWLEDSHPEDPRILGTDQFVASLRLPPFRPKSAMTLGQLAHSVCALHGIAIEDLTSPRRHATLMLARRELTQRAIDERIANLKQVADYLRREPSSIGRLLRR